MLIQFSVENFLSIKEKVVLSLLASKDNEHPNHLIADETNRYLKSAVIYGANASGKSNVLNAFWFMLTGSTALLSASAQVIMTRNPREQKKTTASQNFFPILPPTAYAIPFAQDYVSARKTSP